MVLAGKMGTEGALGGLYVYAGIRIGIGSRNCRGIGSIIAWLTASIADLLFREARAF